MLHRGVWCLRRHSTHDHAHLQQSTGFATVHLSQCIGTQTLTDTGQVNRLTTRHARMARGAGQQAAQTRLHRSRHVTVFWREQFKRQGLQSVARQQGLRFAKLHMHRGLAPAQHIVVHAGHVVMHQRISVDEFNGTCGPHGRIQGPSNGLVVAGFHAGQHQQGAQAFATIEHGIAHGFTQPSWGMGWHPVVQGLFDGAQMRLAPCVHVKTAHASSVQLFRLPVSSTWICSSTALS